MFHDKGSEQAPFDEGRRFERIYEFGGGDSGMIRKSDQDAAYEPIRCQLPVQQESIRSDRAGNSDSAGANSGGE